MKVFSKKNNRFDDANTDYDDIIAKLVEEAMASIEISLDGLSTNVDIEEIGPGASLNEKIKAGVIEASKTARQTYSVVELHKKLMTAKRNVHGIRDDLLPQQQVLEIGVRLLTESYREPMKKLLQESSFLTTSIQTILKDTLGFYEKFERVVMEIIQTEIGKNKLKAEEYMDVQVDLHKRFVNCEHVEFTKSTELLKKNGGMRYKNNFNLWFKEGIPNDKQNNEENGFYNDQDDSGVVEEEEVVDRALEATLGSLGSQLVNLGVKKVRGFVTRLKAKKEDVDVHFNKLPTEAGEQAQWHLDLLLQ